jgi:actin-related protein
MSLMKKTITHRGVVYRQVTKPEVVATLKRLARETGDKRLLDAAAQIQAIIAEEKVTVKKKRKATKKSPRRTGKRSSK